MTDSRGNTYTLAIGPTTGTGLRQSIYYAKNIAAGSNTVTVTFNKAAAFVDVRVLEYSGLDTVNPLDKTAGAAGSGTTASSGAATTTSANELIFGAGMTVARFTGGGNRIYLADHHQLRTPTSRKTRRSPRPEATVPPPQQHVQLGDADGHLCWLRRRHPRLPELVPPPAPRGRHGRDDQRDKFRVRVTVTFGGNAATNVTVLNTRVISATTPAAVAGAVTVTVTNSGGKSGALANGYTYTSTGNPHLGLPSRPRSIRFGHGSCRASRFLHSFHWGGRDLWDRFFKLYRSTDRREVFRTHQRTI